MEELQQNQEPKVTEENTSSEGIAQELLKTAKKQLFYTRLSTCFVGVMAIAVVISLFAVVMFASIFGTLVPMTLEKLKVDPAIATGPFISITNDIIGMMLYMGITVLLS